MSDLQKQPIFVKDLRFNDDLSELFEGYVKSVNGIFADENKNVRLDTLIVNNVHLHETNSISGAKFRVGCYCKEKNITVMSSKAKGLFWTEDGINYIQCTADSSVAEDRKTFIEATGSFETAEYDGSKFIVTGNSGVWYSEDGKTWKSTQITIPCEEIVHSFDEVNNIHYYSIGTWVTTETDPSKQIIPTNIAVTEHGDAAAFINGTLVVNVGSLDIAVAGTPFTDGIGFYHVTGFDSMGIAQYEKCAFPEEDLTSRFHDYRNTDGGCDSFTSGKAIVGGELKDVILIPTYKAGAQGLLYTTDGLTIKKAKGSYWTTGRGAYYTCGYETPAITKEGYVIAGGGSAQNMPLYMVWKDLQEDPVTTYLDGVAQDNTTDKGFFSTKPEFCEQTQCWYGCAYKRYSKAIVWSKDIIHWYSSNSVGKFTGPTIIDGKLLFTDQDGKVMYAIIYGDTDDYYDTTDIADLISRKALQAKLNTLPEPATIADLIEALKNI